MRKRQGFTLVELLVVIAIIAVLIAILLPVLTRAKESANRVVCMNNHRQLIMATRMYADEWKNVLPYCNSNSFETDGSWTAPGWLYWGIKGKDQEQFVEYGVLWKYIKNRKIYRCPFDPAPYAWGVVHNITSYAMNRAVLGLDPNPLSPTYNKLVFKPSWKITQFKPDDILFWESDDSLAADTGYWNDGCNTPNQGITARHGSSRQRGYGSVVQSKAAGAIVGCISGSVEWITVYEFYKDSANVGGRVQCGPYYRR